MGGAAGNNEYEWFEKACEDLRALTAEYELDWKTSCNAPADPEAVARAETALGTPLPPSLRRFYAVHDGCTLAEFRVLGVAEACDTTLRDRGADLKTYDVPSNDFITVVDANDGNTFRLLTSKRSPEGEYPVVDAFHEYGPKRWRNAQIAVSFDEWLIDLFDQVLLQRVVPHYPGWATVSLDDASRSPERYYRQGIELAAKGSTGAARARFLKAAALQGLANPSELRRYVSALVALNSEDPGDRFLDRVLQRGIELCNIAMARQESSSIDIYDGESDRSLATLEADLGTPLPAFLRGLAKSHSGVSFTLRSGELSLHLYGGHQLRAVDSEYMPISHAPHGSVVVGEIHEGRRGRSFARDYLVIEPSGALSIAHFRGPGRGAPKARPLGVTIDEFLDQLIERYRRGGVPLDWHSESTE